jgi:formylglycine-generating enzyme required for sulfatase activity
MRNPWPLASLALGVSLLLLSCSAGIPRAGSSFRDCEGCPEMVTIPAGRFLMGSLPAETGNRGWPAKVGGNERPRHEVTIARPFAIGKYEVTRGQFAAFVAATGYQTTGGCLDFSGSAMGPASQEGDWRNPGFAQADDEPALCISWLDAQAYAGWLSQKTGQPYRLPSEAEWEYVARAGTTTAYAWGDSLDGACQHANVHTEPGWKPGGARNATGDTPFTCDDGVQRSAPVGRYRANAFGVHDMHGNAYEWTADCNHPDYQGAPTDGSAWADDPACMFRIMRGGAFINGPRQTRSASRVGRPASGRASSLGFRVARSFDGSGLAAAPAAVAPSAITIAPGLVPEQDVALFNTNCGACHIDPRTFRGIYGQDQHSVEKVIREGGSNSMSMPPWEGKLSPDEIRRLAILVRAATGWDKTPGAPGGQ